LKSAKFIIFRNPRLKFNQSSALVEGFISDRLYFYGVLGIDFVDNLDLALKRADALTKKLSGDYIVIMDVMNPIVDLLLVDEMISCLQRNDASVASCEGAIPGTQVEYVFDTSKLAKLPDDLTQNNDLLIHKRWTSQKKHNNQFNLYKYKRLKLFLKLLENLNRMHEMSIDEFCTSLEQDNIFNMLVSFGENVPLVWHSDCPHCHGLLVPLQTYTSQPLLGYLPSTRPLYHECERCKLIVLSPAIHQDKFHIIYDKFDQEDFAISTRSPVDETSPRCDFSLLKENLTSSASVLDLGGGVGLFSQFIKGTYRTWNVTHSDLEGKVDPQLKSQGIETRKLNFLEECIGDKDYDLITAWEVVEHIPYPKLLLFFDNVFKALKPGAYFVFSTPDFDSPLCKTLDFYAAVPPFHYTVFSEKWLRNFITKIGKWKYLSPRACSDFLDDAEMWFDYASKACPSLESRETSMVLKEIFALDKSKSLRNALLDKGFGTEVIITLQKKT
jgi:2-polyprenyl-3-methyl-5-hydroxy-6-metoxy-1,4-benzoquinol methylase